MPKVISDQFVQNAWALGDRWRNERKMSKIRNAMSDWDTNPDAAVSHVMQIDPDAGLSLERTLQAKRTQQAELAEKTRQNQLGTLKTVVGILDGAAKSSGGDPNNISATYDQITPILKGTFGMDDSQVAYYKGALTSNPKLISVLKQRLDPDKPILSGPGSELLDTDGNVLHSTPAVPKGMQAVRIRRGDGGFDTYVFNPNTGAFEAPGSGGGTVDSGGSGPLTAPEAWNIIAPNEGGYTPDDGNGHPANFGFNQKFNPDINVKDLTPDSARQRYIDTRFPPEAANMPRPLAIAYADTYFMNPGKAKQFLNDSGGDPERFMQLREAWMNRLPHAEAYAQRNANIRMAMGGGGGAAPSGGGIKPAITTPGKPEPVRARQLSSEEVAERSLNPAYQWQEMPNGETKIIGPAKQAGPTQKQTVEQIDQSLLKSDTLINSLSQLINHPGVDRITGPIYGRLPDLTGEAADAEAIRRKVVNQIASSALQSLRAVSANGSSGLGNTNVKDIELLEQSLASLTRVQTTDQFLKEARTALDIAKRTRQTIENARQRLLTSQGGGGGGKGGGGETQPNIPQGAVEYLKAHRDGATRLQFDKKYGKGAAKAILGTASITTDMPTGVKTPYGTRI